MSRLDELREHYDNTDLSDSLETARIDDIVADDVLVSTSIRLPKPLLDRVRRRAADAGVPATTLMRQWILDRLDESQSDAVVSVADLEQFIAQRSHPAAS
jgi:predicted DNA binding CopG/RHH family protein